MDVSEPQDALANPHLDGELFDASLPTAWLDDETLFSLCSRHHRLSGNRLAANTCLQLFGHVTQGTAHDFPSRLGEFAQRTRQQLGSATQIIHEHTLLPFYLPFRPPEMGQRAVAALRGSSIGSLKFQLGLLTSRFRANHPLKACPECMRAEQLRWSTPYWHVRHQLPGVWVCPLHGEPLQASSLKATGVNRFHWVLPDPSHLVNRGGLDAPHLRALMGLATTAIELWSLPPGRQIAPERAGRACRRKLRERGLICGDGRGRLRLRDIGAEYAAHVAPLRVVAELNELPGSTNDAAREIARIAYAPRAGIHPLRYLAMVGWLFGDLRSFIAYIDEAIDELPHRGRASRAPAEPATTDPRREQLLNIVRCGSSLSSAARQIGVDPATGMAWAAAAGIAIQKRPSIIGGDLKKRMMEALESGAEKADVAAIAGVSIESVTRLLRTEIGLQERWRLARRQRTMLKMRRAWEGAMAANPHLRVKAARLLEPAAYAWLYRNDRAWLNALASRHPRGRPVAAVRVDWSARDRVLAEAVRREALILAKASPGTKVKLWQLYQRLPQLKAKLAHLERLPITLRAITEALSASTDYPRKVPLGDTLTDIARSHARTQTPS